MTVLSAQTIRRLCMTERPPGQLERDENMIDQAKMWSRYTVGGDVKSVTDPEFSGRVLSVFKNTHGATYYVVERIKIEWEGIESELRLFNEEQLVRIFENPLYKMPLPVQESIVRLNPPEKPDSSGDPTR